MSRPDDPLGRRSLFGPPLGKAADAPRPAGREPAGREPGSQEADGRRAFFSVPPTPPVTPVTPDPPTATPSGPAVVVACQACRARTPVSWPYIGLHVLPSLWLPLTSWSRWMRCPSCERRTWCRVEWKHLLTGH